MLVNHVTYLMEWYNVCVFCSFAVTFAAEEAVKMGGEEIKMGTMVDDINAYSYAYPLELPSEKLVFKWYCYMHVSYLEAFTVSLPNSSTCISLKQ